MKRIWITTAALLLAGVGSLKAQTDSTVTTADTTLTTTDSTYQSTTSSSSTRVTNSMNDDKGGVRFGIRAGVHSSNVIKSGTADVTTGAKLGFNTALFVEIPIVRGFSVQPELQFAQKGYKSSGTYLSQPYEYKLTSNFFEIPLLAKFKMSKNVGILLGPSFSFLTSTKTDFKVANAEYEKLVDQDNDNLRKNILGGVLGFEAGAGPVIFGLRYNIDFKKNNGDGSSSQLQYKNQVIAFTAGIRL